MDEFQIKARNDYNWHKKMTAMGYVENMPKTAFELRMEAKEQQERLEERRAEDTHNFILLNRYPPYRPPESTQRPLKITLEDGRVILATEYKVLRKRR